MLDEKKVEQLRKRSNGNPEVVIEHLAKEQLVPEAVLNKLVDIGRKEILSNHYPYKSRMDRPTYENEKKRLQVELVKLQNDIKRQGKKVVIVFEGRDAAGKGGAIKRFTEHLNPRGARVVALVKPSEKERGQWYFQRYVDHLPTNGEIIFFDRSWYNRGGVEKVMGFCSNEEHQEFTRQVLPFEEMLIRSHIALTKFWFSVSREEQLQRFISRIVDPLKQWKISPMDLASLPKWEDYTKAKEQMFTYSDSSTSPWIVVKSDCKKRARINAMKYILSLFDYKDKDSKAIGHVDSKILGSAQDIYESDELIYRNNPSI